MAGRGDADGERRKWRGFRDPTGVVVDICGRHRSYAIGEKNTNNHIVRRYDPLTSRPARTAESIASSSIRSSCPRAPPLRSCLLSAPLARSLALEDHSERCLPVHSRPAQPPCSALRACPTDMYSFTLLSCRHRPANCERGPATCDGRRLQRKELPGTHRLSHAYATGASPLHHQLLPLS